MIQPPVDLVATIAGPTKPVAAGATTSDSVVVRNTGSAASSGTTTVNVYAPFAHPSYSGSGWTCTTSGTCSTSNAVPAGGSLPSITVTSTAPDYIDSGSGGASLSNSVDGDSSDNEVQLTTWS